MIIIFLCNLKKKKKNQIILYSNIQSLIFLLNLFDFVKQIKYFIFHI